MKSTQRRAPLRTTSPLHRASSDRPRRGRRGSAGSAPAGGGSRPRVPHTCPSGPRCSARGAAPAPRTPRRTGSDVEDRRGLAEVGRDHVAVAVDHRHPVRSSRRACIACAAEARCARRRTGTPRAGPRGSCASARRPPADGRRASQPQREDRDIGDRDGDATIARANRGALAAGASRQLAQRRWRRTPRGSSTTIEAQPRRARAETRTWAGSRDAIEPAPRTERRPERQARPACRRAARFRARDARAAAVRETMPATPSTDRRRMPGKSTSLPTGRSRRTCRAAIACACTDDTR